MITFKLVEDKDEITRVTLEIMNALPEWFSPPEDIVNKSKIHRDFPFIAVYDDDKAIGFSALKIHNEFTADVYDIGILKEYHSQGIGHKLMEECVRYCKEKGFKLFEKGYSTVAAASMVPPLRSFPSTGTSLLSRRQAAISAMLQSLRLSAAMTSTSTAATTIW